MRCSKSCRLRWTNYLRPGIKRGNFTDHEEKMIVHLQALLGNRLYLIHSFHTFLHLTFLELINLDIIIWSLLSNYT